MRDDIEKLLIKFHRMSWVKLRCQACTRLQYHCFCHNQICIYCCQHIWETDKERPTKRTKRNLADMR